MTRILFPFQSVGSEWLADRQHGYLADEMGLGKTPQAIEGLNRVPWAETVAVICPAFLSENWRRETAKWANRSWSQEVVSYEIAARDGLPKAEAYVFDEAHYLKGPESMRTKELLGLRDNVLDPDHLLRQALYVWPLSGTPTPNHPGEVWTWLRAFGATELPYVDFLMRFCRTRTTQYGLKPMGLKRKALPELKALLAPYFLRRTASDTGRETPLWGELFVAPDVDRNDLQFGPVDSLEGDELDEALDDLRDDYAFNQLLRLLGEAKARPLGQLLGHEIRDDGEKQVVVAWHKSVLAGLGEALEPFGKGFVIDGSTSMAARQAMFDAFQNDPSVKWIAIQTLIAVGVTLTAAWKLTFAELCVTPGPNAQAAKRVDRIGQTHPVLIRVCSLGDTLDHARNRILTRKTQMITETWS